MFKKRLMLFVRYPRAGQTKTRLIPTLGAAGAAQLQREMAEYLLHRLQQPHWQLQVHFTGGTRLEMIAWLGNKLSYYAQVGEDLGDRLQYGFQQGFQPSQPHPQTHQLPIPMLAIGADCIDLSADHVHQAFEALEHREIVLGPAQDGGYYLIGIRQFRPTLKTLFDGIDWSSPHVLQQTQARIRQLGLSWAQLETLSDIDRPEDLVLWERVQMVSKFFYR